MHRLLLALAHLGALVAVGSPAAAEDKRGLRLSWSAPAGCPSATEVRAAATARVEADAAGDVLEADAAVEQAGTSLWRVRLRTTRGSASGERTIEATTCSGVAEAASVLLALALVPTLVPGSTAVSEPPPPAAAPLPPAIAPAKEVAPPRREEPASRAPHQAGDHAVAAGLFGAVDPSTLPSIALGGGLALAWTPGRLRLEAAAKRWASQSASLATQAAGARFAMTTLGVRGCYEVVGSASFDLAPCAGGDLVFVDAPGFGAESNYDASARWASLGAGALGRVKIERWLALRAAVDAVVPLARPSFVVEGLASRQGDLHRPSAIGVAASFGLELLFL